MLFAFLSLDGVLNSYGYFKGRPEASGNAIGPKAFDPEAIRRVNVLADAGVKFVLTSAWRGTAGLYDGIAKAGFVGRWAGETPRMSSLRGLEIIEYLRTHPKVKSYVILDDDMDMFHLSYRHVRTNYFRGGFLDEHLEQALKILGIRVR